MAGTPAKKVKVELKSAIRRGFGDRGWRPVPGDSSTFQAPAAVVALPLCLRVTVTIDSYRYGGATLTASAVIQSDAVNDILVRFDADAMPDFMSDFPGDQMTRSSLTLGIQTAGGLLDPLGNHFQWVVPDLDALEPVVGEFFAMMEGPLLDWVADRNTPDKVLAGYHEEAGSGVPIDSAAVRAVSALALLEGRAEVARELLGTYLPGLGDDPGRIARFEEQLSEHFSSYGSLQRG